MPLAHSNGTYILGRPTLLHVYSLLKKKKYSLHILFIFSSAMSSTGDWHKYLTIFFIKVCVCVGGEEGKVVM
jgi:hypothetical protein